jgi:apolipoprotein N-acyltransferase
MGIPLPGTTGILLALATSAMLIALAPRWSLTFLAPVALVPLLAAIQNEPNPRQRMLLGFAAGIPYWFVVCLWIQHVLAVHGGLEGWLAWFSFALFSFLKAIHLAVFSTAAGYTLKLSPQYGIPLTAALWTGIERTHGTFGFAWLTLGDAGIDMPWLLGIPSLVGVYGISFLFALTATATVTAIATRKPIHLTWIAAALIVPLAVLPKAAEPPTQRALVVQPMMPQASVWTSELLTQKLKGLIELSLPKGNDSPLLIWPEMPGPIYFDSDPAFHEMAVVLAQTRQRYFLFGTVTRTSRSAPLNTAIMLTPTGAEVARYNKMNLVPFGEFVPAAFAWVNRITQEAGDFEPGTQQTTFATTDFNAGVFICYESAFPEFVRQFAKQGATFYANISNDGYFGESKAREQHLSLVRMRAVESRRWIIRATNSGITAVVDPLGRVTETLPEYQHIAKEVQYGVSQEVTPYSRYGDWFAWGCLAAGLVALLTSVLASHSRGL